MVVNRSQGTQWETRPLCWTAHADVAEAERAEQREQRTAEGGGGGAGAGGGAVHRHASNLPPLPPGQRYYDCQKLQLGGAALNALAGRTTNVSRAFPSCTRPILAEIYLCHACSCQEILRTETLGQVHITVAQSGVQVYAASSSSQMQKAAKTYSFHDLEAWESNGDPTEMATMAHVYNPQNADPYPLERHSRAPAALILEPARIG
eukprot:COSAG01_NODE_1235_length_11106_cov_3.058962_11_plen_206_part_00